MCFSGSLDAEQTSQLYRSFMELVEANEQSRKGAVKPPPSSAVSSSFTSSRSRAEPPPNSQTANGAGHRESLLSSRPTSSSTSPVVSPLTGTLLVPRGDTGDDTASTRVGSYSSSPYSNGPTAAGQRESLRSSRFSSSNTPPVVSPLTGTVLAPRLVKEDGVASTRTGSYFSSPSYANGPTTAAESSHLRGSSSSSPYSSRLTNSTAPGRFDDGLAAGRVVNGGGGTMSRYGDAAAATSYQAASRLDDASSPAARLQSLRDSYSSTMWNDSPLRLSSSGRTGGVDSLASPSGVFDADGTPELLNGPATASSRYERVMSARSRSAARRGDVLSAPRTRITSPAAAPRFAMNDLSDVLQSTTATELPHRSVPYTASVAVEQPPLATTRSTLYTTSSPYTTSTAAEQQPPATSRSTLYTTSSAEQPRSMPSTTSVEPPLPALARSTPYTASLRGERIEKQPPAPAQPRSTPYTSSSLYTASSRAERMKTYGVGTSSNTADNVKAAVTTASPPTSIAAEISATQSSETTVLPSKQHDMTSATRSGSVTSSLKTSSPVRGTELPAKTETAQKPAADDKSVTQRDTVVSPSTNLSKPKNAMVNGSTGTTEVRESRQQSITSSLPARRTGTQSDKLAAPMNGCEIATSDVKSTASGAMSSETGRSRKTDTVDDIAGASLIAATLNRVQAAAAAAADAATSVRGRVEAMEETRPSSVKESSSSEQRTAATEHSGIKDTVATSPLRVTSRARSRAPSSLQEMLDPSAGQKNAKSPSTVNHTNNIAGPGPDRKVSDAPSSPSGKAAKSVESASNSVSKGGAGVKSRSRMVVDVHEMLMPGPGGSGGGGKTQREPANVASTSSSTTSRSRTSSTSSSTDCSSAVNVRPAKPGTSQPPTRRPGPLSDAASRTTADRESVRRPSTSTSSPANKPTQPAQERKLASKTTTAAKQSVETASENDWETTIQGVIQASTPADSVADSGSTVSDEAINPSTSMSSLQSEPPPAAQRRRTSATRDGGLSSLMRPTASSLARRGSTSGVSGAGVPGYAAATSSSASKSASAGMLRTTSSPTLRVGGALSLPSRPAGSGTSSGRTTPTSPRRADMMALPAAGRPAKPTNATASTPGRTPRPGMSTLSQPTQACSQRGAGQTASRTSVVSSRSRHNSAGSSSSSSSSRDAVTGRK